MDEARRRRALLVTLVVGLPVMVVVTVLLASGRPLWVAAAAVLAGAVYALHRLVGGRHRRLAAKAVRLADDALVFEGEEPSYEVALDDVVWGTAAGRGVCLSLRSGHRIEIVFGHVEAAQRLAKQARWGVGRMRIRLPLRGAVGTGVTAFMLGLVLSGVAIWGYSNLVELDGALTWGGLLAVWLGAMVGGWLAALWLAPSLTIGSDGVTLRLRHDQRFIPYSSVVEVVTEDGHAEGVRSSLVTLKLAAGERIMLPTVGWRPLDADILVQAVADAAGDDEPPKHAAAELGRKAGESVAAWETRIARIVSTDTFRKGHVSPAELQAALTNAGERLDRRAGAALALSRLDPENSSAAISAAAQSAANPNARRALEAVVAGKVEQLAKALDAQDMTEREHAREPLPLPGDDPPKPSAADLSESRPKAKSKRRKRRRRPAMQLHPDVARAAWDMLGAEAEPEEIAAALVEHFGQGEGAAALSPTRARRAAVELDRRYQAQLRRGAAVPDLIEEQDILAQPLTRASQYRRTLGLGAAMLGAGAALGYLSVIVPVREAEQGATRVEIQPMAIVLTVLALSAGSTWLVFGRMADPMLTRRRWLFGLVVVAVAAGLYVAVRSYLSSLGYAFIR